MTTAGSVGARVLYVAEPPATYLARRPLVVDCSVLAAIIFAEDAGDVAAERIANSSLQGPWLLQVEIASVALKKHRQGFVEAATDGLTHFSAFGVQLHPTDSAGVHAIAVRYQLSAYDAAYLWLAAELRAPLFSFDEKLTKAAATHLADPP